MIPRKLSYSCVQTSPVARMKVYERPSLSKTLRNREPSFQRGVYSSICPWSAVCLHCTILLVAACVLLIRSDARHSEFEVLVVSHGASDARSHKCPEWRQTLRSWAATTFLAKSEWSWLHTFTAIYVHNKTSQTQRNSFDQIKTFLLYTTK